MSTLWTFLLIWGVWLITPLIVDGIESVGRLITVLSDRRTHRRERRYLDDESVPSVTIIIPAYNEVEVIDRCINSVKAQDFPHDKLEIIVVDDGSDDGTPDRVEEHVNGQPSPGSYLLRGRPINVGPFKGTLLLIRHRRGGKAHALNAGLAIATGDIVVNIDSDVVLDPKAVRAIATYFVRNPDIDAATGNIEIDWNIIEARDSKGRLVLDEKGNLTCKKLSLFQRFLVHSQFLEYLTAFDIGRRAQAITGTMYSLAGACSAFRRSVFESGLAYCNDTVSEDTCLTFQLHRDNHRIGFMADARVHLEPVIDMDSLYAQRVRWSRGQLEVIGVYEDMLGSRANGWFTRWGIPKMLTFDHTLAFPRLVWMPLILCFPLIGYSWKLLAVAVIAMYGFYLVIELANSIVAYTISDLNTRERIEESEWAVLALPLYRFVVFHFRFSGFLVALTERQVWTIQGPMQTAKRDAGMLRLRSIELLTGLVGVFSAVSSSAAALGRAALAGLMPLLVTFAIFIQALASPRRNG